MQKGHKRRRKVAVLKTPEKLADKSHPLSHSLHKRHGLAVSWIRRFWVFHISLYIIRPPKEIKTTHLQPTSTSPMIWVLLFIIGVCTTTTIVVLMPLRPPCSLLFLLLSFSIYTAVAVNQQGQALLSWKASFNESLEALTNWDADDDTPCNWFGIVCNFNNEVVELELRYVDLFGQVPSNFTSLLTLNKLVLSGANLTGSIPKEISTLTRLTHLDLSENVLSGEIPSELCKLDKLQQLYLNSNKIKGSIPIEIGNLTSLKSLILYDNQLSGEIPSSIGNLKSLEMIRAGGNRNLEGHLPSAIGNCTNLVMLGLAETRISGFLPSTLGLLKKLQTIAIYTGYLSGQIPPEIGNCTELQNIYLYENSLAGSIPRSLGNLRNLQSLLLWQNNLVGTIPPELGNCNELLVIDASMNSLTGSIPQPFGNLTSLQELQLSVNRITGEIPGELGNCRQITQIELDNNQISGEIPGELGSLTNLTLLFLWQNKLEGNIPDSISDCHNLEAIDLSQNSLTGPIPTRIFQLKKLNKLLLLSNNLIGNIPPEIGNCSSLIRFRASNNKITGSIPVQVGSLQNLNFLDLGSNRFTGFIPQEISGCRNLTFLDLHSNSIGGTLPLSLSQLVSLQFVDFSDNLIDGELISSLGSLSSLTKLVLGKNRFSGSIPTELGSYSGAGNRSNLSWNQLTGEIPEDFTALDKLAILDISHNQLDGDLRYLAGLQNLVLLNVSYNNFTGRMPDTPFFSKLPLSTLAGNPSICFSGNQCFSSDGKGGGSSSKRRGARVAMVRSRGPHDDCDVDGDADLEMGPPWELTLYQKLDLSIANVTRSLIAGNIIGRGRTGIVYKVSVPSGLTIAVKRFRSSEKTSASSFSSEIATLARIRHRNILRLLGWGANRKTKLLFYDYITNGTLGALLHEGCGREMLDWDIRFKIALGVAEGLAYLHHDCVPAIIHRDVKAHNILLGDRYEPCLADFGLARLVEDDNGASFSANPEFAGSFGYMAPEYGCMLKITEKSDVYSYGVVLLEIITGKKPADPSFPDGHHVIQWVRDHLKNKKDPVEILDPRLQGHPDTQIQEMFQALGISLLCTSNRAEDRPIMKDVAALLKEIRQEPPSGSDTAHKPTSKRTETTASYSPSSVTPAQLLLNLQGSSQSQTSLAYYSSSSANYFPRSQ
ncbi:putative LRR receptor-like serine/threonine-protein kinase [Hibiscus syriacus]|uniref:LRR receptor-like serine/threonine-protein kinase n=1 Tax=Hibiscus syriacus TaxID=106335 RepID=A0A6A3BXQ1_HIBSY|nr:putative LRR receptor-like serine/threonine-protein kinase [Hibiscus syriacus]